MVSTVCVKGNKRHRFTNCFFKGCVCCHRCQIFIIFPTCAHVIAHAFAQRRRLCVLMRSVFAPLWSYGDISILLY
ncbi:hypothetical protein XELAEV_18014275mg [Xenopus laevis]|uniref:Uncharacterized protein n=1 Tax=Xenopus laevis TaxID=8355 RepID=A0A974DHT7_XENLA|nr:hypothetical protein XELAEV_18014275mg [Xenopus laevis]